MKLRTFIAILVASVALSGPVVAQESVTTVTSVPAVAPALPVVTPEEIKAKARELRINDNVLIFSLPAVMAFIFIGLFIESIRARSIFRLVHFVTDSQGRGSKYALAYVVILIIGGWGLWVMIVRNTLQEWYWTSYIAAFVIGAVAGTVSAVNGAKANVAVPPANSGDAPKE